MTPRERANAPATPEFRARVRAVDEARIALRKASAADFDRCADELTAAAALLALEFDKHMGWSVNAA